MVAITSRDANNTQQQQQRYDLLFITSDSNYTNKVNKKIRENYNINDSNAINSKITISGCVHNVRVVYK